MDNYKYLVCTRCFTFNHGPYINDALNGFAIQKTSFPVVFVIVDDASTDNTATELLKFAHANLDLADDTTAYEKETDYAKVIYAKHKTSENSFFAILLLKENHYSRRLNKLPYLTEWMGNAKYIALCEGDDYWINPDKLQLQVDFMEANEDYGLCYTQCRYYYQNEKRMAAKPWGGDNESFNQFMKTNTIPTATALYSAKLYEQYVLDVQPSTRKWKLGDYPTWVWMSHEKKVKFIPVVTGVYRFLSDSASGRNDYEKALAFGASSRSIKRYFNEKYNYGLTDDYFKKGELIFNMKTAARFQRFNDFFVNWGRLIRYSPKYGLFYYKVYGFLLLFVSKKMRIKHS